MKFTKYALAAALVASIWGRGAVAQQPNYGQQAPVVTPSAVRPVAYEYYSGQESQTQQPQFSYASSYDDGSQGAAPVAATGACNTCDTSGDCCCQGDLFSRLFPCCCKVADLGDQKKLFDGCFFKEHNINAGGWIAQSYTWNPYRPADRSNGPVTWTDRANDYQMNELYAYLGKATDTKGCGWDWGYRVDALYGTSYRWNTEANLESKWNSGRFYGLALPAFYGEVAYNDLTVKIGHFTSPVGFYAVGTANNFFPVLPYTYQYGEPFTHTGFLANYKYSDNLQIGGGLIRGWDNFGNFNPNLGAIATSTYTRENKDTIAYVGILSREPTALVQAGRTFVGTFNSRYFQTLVYTHKFSDDVMGVLQSDFGYQNGGTGAGSLPKDAYWYGVNSYLYWNMTCRCQWGLNGEWFRDQDGYRVGTLLPSPGSPTASGWTQPGGAVGGFHGNFFRATFGPKYNFTPNLYGRAAMLFDYYQGSRDGAGNMPFDVGTKQHQEMAVFDLVYTF